MTRPGLRYRSSHTANSPDVTEGDAMLARNMPLLGVFAAAMLASPAARAQVSDDVVKIGVLTDMNGPASTPTGQGSVTAAQTADDRVGANGHGRSRQRHVLRPR